MVLCCLSSVSLIRSCVEKDFAVIPFKLHICSTTVFFFSQQFDSPLSENLWKQVEHVLQVHLVLNFMGLCG